MPAGKTSTCEEIVALTIVAASKQIKARLFLSEVLEEQAFIPVTLHLLFKVYQLLLILLYFLPVRSRTFFKSLHPSFDILHYLLIIDSELCYRWNQCNLQEKMVFSRG